MESAAGPTSRSTENAMTLPRPSTDLHLAVYCDATATAGAEQSLATLLGGLAPEIRVTIVGVEADVVAWLAQARPQAETAVLDSVRDKRDLKPILAHVRYFRRLRADILQVNLRHSYACQFAVLGGLLAPHTRVVAVEHFPTAPTARLQGLLKRLTSRRLAAHVAVSRSSARKVEEIVGYPRGYVHAIYAGVERMPDRAPASSNGGPPRVGALGRLVPEKGFDVFLRALQRVPSVAGVLVGDGPERADLEQLVDELELRERVSLTGWRSDAHALMASFDAVVVPSRSEPLGLVALEAMSWGLPVVASRVGGLAEIVRDGETGFLVPPDDVAALSAAIERSVDREAGRELGANGLVVARRDFSEDDMARAFEDLYRKVLG
jgi:glycosyltransferase involved in cell wall biosynthesis